MACKRCNFFRLSNKGNLNLIVLKGITGDVLQFMTERQIVKCCRKGRHQNEALCLPFHSLWNASLRSGGPSGRANNVEIPSDNSLASLG